MSEENKIAITGLGVISPIGVGKQSFFQGLQDGRSGIKRVTLFDTSTIRSKLAGEISDFNPEKILDQKGLRNLDRSTTLVLAAAKLAVEDGRLEISSNNTDRLGVVIGSTMGSVCSISDFDRQALKEGPRSVNPALFPNTVINSPASQISIRLGIKGFNTTISSGFTSSFDAIEYAMNFLRLGRAQAVLVGAVEELCEQTYKGFYKIGFLSGSRGGEEICSPFDRRRNGAIIGEGAAVFLMEPYLSARERCAQIYGLISPIESTFDPGSYHRYNLRATGLIEVIKAAVEMSGKSLNDIDYISSAANSTVGGDYCEAKAIRSVCFRKRKMVVSAVKSMLGESFSAGGAFQLASALFSIAKQCVAPTISYEVPDSRCGLDIIPTVALPMKVANVLLVSPSPMGKNSAVVVSGA